MLLEGGRFSRTIGPLIDSASASSQWQINFGLVRYDLQTSVQVIVASHKKS